jgi:hypothetical protein
MATTTNYGWTTPDDTALVKDGAAAIRTLGSSVDTTTKNLNPETTLGDIAYRSSTANVNTRLGIGSTGQILTVASGLPSWATPATPSSGMNLISRTAFSATSALTLDSLFSNTYENYYLTFSCHGSSSAAEIRLQGRYSTTTHTGANYQYAYAGYNKDAGVDDMRGSAATSFYLNTIQVSSLPNLTTMWFYRDQTSNKLRYTLSMWDQRYGAGRAGGGIIESNQTWTGLYIFPDAGTMTGEVTIYGLAKA